MRPSSRSRRIRKKWTPGSRFIRTARTNQDGRYNLRGLPPDDYFVVAIRDIEPGEWQDPEILDSLRDLAIRVTFNEGETKVQDLKTAKTSGDVSVLAAGS